LGWPGRLISRPLGVKKAAADVATLQRLYAMPNVVLLGEGTLSLPGEKVMSGWTAAYVALKIAYHMGFATVLLVGVDHSAEWDHFTADYPHGDRMNSGRFAGQREHFALAETAFRAENRSIVNLSPPSQLDTIFRRGEIEQWIDQKC
jgi:hypothetical protein